MPYPQGYGGGSSGGTPWFVNIPKNPVPASVVSAHRYLRRGQRTAVAPTTVIPPAQATAPR